MENQDEMLVKIAALSDESIADFKSTLDISMSDEELILCRNYYRDHGRFDIPISTLKLIDTIAEDLRKSPKALAITSLWTDNKDIFETYVDMASKYCAVTHKKNAPLPLSSAPDVADGYSRITRKRAPELISISGIGQADGTPLFPRTDELCRYRTALAPTTAFALLTPTEATTSAAYLKSVESFVSCDGISDKVILVRKISHGGIISALSEVTSGVLADISVIPEAPADADISIFANAHHGRFIIALTQTNIEFASALAEYYGLAVTYFAKVILGERLVFVPANNIADTIDLPLVRTLASITRTCEVRIDEATHSSGKPLQLTDGERALSHEELLLRGNYVYSACASLLGDAPFSAALNTALQAVLSIIACGAERSDVSLKLRYTLPEGAPGDALAAMLGIYRVMSELYLSGESAVEYTDGAEPSVSVAAFTNAKNLKVIKKLTQEHSGVYLLSFDRTESGMPSFESFRAMCDFYAGCLKDRSVLSASAVNGSLSDALSEMSSEFECKIADPELPFYKERVCGIIVESKIPFSHGVFLGTTARKITAI